MNKFQQGPGHVHWGRSWALERLGYSNKNWETTLSEGGEYKRRLRQARRNIATHDPEKWLEFQQDRDAGRPYLCGGYPK